MRNAQQLIDAATATGTYASYVGDGASVPWENVIPPVGEALFFYKAYLDARWPQAFKLHDWCYTILGALIQVTRDEADAALFEIIARDSLADATIVYTAVRAFGGQYFGISTTGLTGPGVRNMALTPEGRNSVATKVVLMFKDLAGSGDAVQARVAGFSESVWHSSDDPSTVRLALTTGAGTSFGLLVARAACLPATAAIIAYKLYKGGSGKGSSTSVSYPGDAGNPTDIPNLALQMNCRSAVTGGVRRWLMHAVPDRFCVNGVYVPDTAYFNAVNAYQNSLTQFSFYTKPVTEVGFKITTIVQVPPTPPATSPNGLVTTLQPMTFVQGDQVRIYSTVTGTNTKISLTTNVLSVSSATQILIPNWTNGNTTGGIIGSPLKSLDAFDKANMGIGRITTRKVGRPFDVYRGRRSRRRAVA